MDFDEFGKLYITQAQPKPWTLVVVEGSKIQFFV